MRRLRRPRFPPNGMQQASFLDPPTPRTLTAASILHPAAWTTPEACSLRGRACSRYLGDRVERSVELLSGRAETEADVGGHAKRDPRREQHAVLGQLVDERKGVGPWAGEPEVDAALGLGGVAAGLAGASHHQVAPLAVRLQVDAPGPEVEQRALRGGRCVDEAKGAHRL